MKKILVFFALLLVCTSCTNSGKSSTEPIEATELLKISTWLLDADLEGTGRWGYIDPETREPQPYPDGDGYWIPDDGITQVANEDVFVYEALEVGVPRTMAPMGLNMYREKGDYISYVNLNLYIDYDGIVEITKVDPIDNSIRLVDATATKGNYGKNWVDADGITTNGPCIINVCPVGKKLVLEGLNKLLVQDTLVDREYTLQIRACTLNGAPIITAEVKITAIPDPEYPWETKVDEGWGELNRAGEERTRFCSIELVSYTFNELYYLNGEAG